MRQSLRTIVENTLLLLKSKKQLELTSIPNFTIEPPKNEAHGDFSCNVSMLLTKSEKKNPRAIASMIVDCLVDDESNIEKVEIAGPGFLNFFVKDKLFYQVVDKVFGEKDCFGCTKLDEEKTVNVEFVSANPTGPLHLGHARGAFMGDAVSRLLSSAGYNVTREYYVNDFGKQVKTLGETVYARYQELYGAKIELLPGQYPAEYVIDIAQGIKDIDGDRWLKNEKKSWLPYFTNFAIETNLSNIKQTLKLCNIEMDVWVSEKELHAKGQVEKTVELFRERGELYDAKQAHGSEDKVRRDNSKAAQFTDDQKGGTFLNTSKYGDEEDRILLRHDGTPVYLTADLAYHNYKVERQFDRIIDVLGADHAGHVPRIRGGMMALGEESSRLEFILVQIVHLMREGKEVKISKRSGEIYELKDLIEEVGQDVVRFIFLMRAATTQFDFDLELALKKSNDNPVFYCQMGHARCVNVLKKAADKGYKLKMANIAQLLPLLQLPEEKLMLKKVSFLPDVVKGAAETLEPHKVLFYIQDLISDFHSYFGKYKNTHRILSDDKDLSLARLAMVDTIRQTLRNALELLGISAPEWMEMPNESSSSEKVEQEG